RPARQPVGALDVEVPLAGGIDQALAVAHRLLERPGVLLDLRAPEILAHQLLGDLAGGVVEAALLGRLALLEPDDVEAEVGAHDLAGLARLEGEGGLLEGRHHLPAREEAEVAALVLRARVLAHVARDRLEVLAAADAG